MPSRRRAVTSSPVAPDPIWVEDRRGTGLPYSKGLMAASIMATGLGPGRAYELAARIEDELRSRRVERISADELASTAARVLARDEGPQVAEMYLAWRWAKRSSRPIVVLIGGATGVGKSTVATKLAARLDLPRVIPTDAVRQVMRTFLPPDEAPEIHRSSFEDPSSPVLGFVDQASRVASGVIGLIERAVTERFDLIVEGVHLVPGLSGDPRVRRVSSEAVIIEVLLVVQDPAVHRAHFLNRLENEHGRSPGRYLRRFSEIRRVQDHLIELARRTGTPIVDVGNLDSAIQSVVDLVVSQVTAGGVEAAAG
ncbi:MAG: hypothetical protein KatS3mg011_1356 [Acidimicrobiia bacterium]|nr:MAG: hypothetical protein KatS3mg011_1356 [Acidimicrobiia bacterium]